MVDCNISGRQERICGGNEFGRVAVAATALARMVML
jgi:hypothetical protein